jgi:hypothetical protein
LTECGDLSEAEAEETEMSVVAVKTAETGEALETAAVTIMMAVLTIKAAAMLVMTMAAAAVTALIEVAVTERAVAVYRRGCWFVSNVSDVRTMWNITPRSTLESANKFAERIVQGIEEVKAALTKVKDKHTMFYNHRCEPALVYAPGDRVWLDGSDIATNRPSSKLSH